MSGEACTQGKFPQKYSRQLPGVFSNIDSTDISFSLPQMVLDDVFAVFEKLRGDEDVFPSGEPV